MHVCSVNKRDSETVFLSRFPFPFYTVLSKRKDSRVTSQGEFYLEIYSDSFGARIIYTLHRFEHSEI